MQLASREVEATERAREKRNRRAAERQGLKLTRSRRRDPRALDYGRYWLTDASGDLVTPEQGVTLDEIEAYLNRPTTTQQ